MNLDDIIRKLKSVNFVLDDLEVKGRKNLDILLGSIQTIDKIVEQLEMGMNMVANPPTIELAPPAEGEEISE